MCGIIAYIGSKEAAPILLSGLRRLEYRGYDSAGLATIEDGALASRKCIGRIASLASLLEQKPIRGTLGISHTRWATHGSVADENAHPHADRSGRLLLVHNGVIENYRSLKEELAKQGHSFLSQTDSEILAHLIGREYDSDASGKPAKERLVAALGRALKRVTGTYGITLIHQDCPDLIVGARRGSPLVLGIGQNEHFLASDASAIVAHTRDAIYLKDGDIACVTRDDFEIVSMSGGESSYEISTVEFSESDVSKGMYPHYMLKEIFEQPESLAAAMRGRLAPADATTVLGGLEMSPKELRQIDRIIVTGCGSALHAAMVGEYMIESLAQIPVEVDFASEFRYRNTPISKDTLVFAVSQSGEPAATLAALRECKRKGHRALGICNNVASTIARESDGGVYMHAGPEIGVAATKSFTSQVTIFALLAVLLGRLRSLSSATGLRMLSELEALPDAVRVALTLDAQIKDIALKYRDADGMLFFGRQFNYPTALEGALKMKEISYVKAEGHPSAELKHGVIALVTPEVPSVFIAPHDSILDKNLSNIEEIKARKGPVIAIGTGDCSKLRRVADDVIALPACPDYLSPILAAIPLQLLAYHLAVARGCDVDKPRNLAKSVTVE